jgi:hypothetical protein
VPGGGEVGGWFPRFRFPLAFWNKLKKNRTMPETRVIRKNVNAKKDSRPRTKIAPRARKILVLRGICDPKFID